MSKYRVQGESGSQNPLDVSAQVISQLIDRPIDSKTWRKNYRQVFAELSELEYNKNSSDFFYEALTKLQNSIRDSDDNTPLENLNWYADLVTTVRIEGNGKAKLFDFSELPIGEWISKGIAEPELIKVQQSGRVELPADQVLFAVGAGAEYGPGREWIEIGGSFAAVMRPNFSKWSELIRFTRESGGTLLVPVLNSKLVNCGENFLDDDEVLAEMAGLDAVTDLMAVSGWLRSVSAEYSQITLGLWGYAPGPKHLILQACMDALADIAMQHLPQPQLTLSWLGTPTDSVMLNNNGRHTVVNAAVDMQGPNYLWAKRSQRWRAEFAHQQGYRTAYLVLPPAYTESVLQYNWLRIAYAGAETVGIFPFKIALARKTALALLLWKLNQPAPSGQRFEVADLAVSGGLWSLGPDPSRIWKWSVVVGLFKPWWRIKPGQ
jgi:hypothetical protein